MRRTVSVVLAALAVIWVPQYVAAQERDTPDPPRPGAQLHRPNPDNIFHRLDVNHDGVITPDEIPQWLPERLKQFFTEEIEKHGGKLTRRELAEDIDSIRPGMSLQPGAPARPRASLGSDIRFGQACQGAAEGSPTADYAVPVAAA